MRQAGWLVGGRGATTRIMEGDLRLSPCLAPFLLLVAVAPLCVPWLLCTQSVPACRPAPRILMLPRTARGLAARHAPCNTARALSSASGDFYPGVGKIQYEGSESKNPLSFKHYNADEVILGRTMKDWSVHVVPA